MTIVSIKPVTELVTQIFTYIKLNHFLHNYNRLRVCNILTTVMNNIAYNYSTRRMSFALFN